MFTQQSSADFAAIPARMRQAEKDVLDRQATAAVATVVAEIIFAGKHCRERPAERRRVSCFREFVDAFGRCDVCRITAVLNGVLGRFASVRDAGAEPFYHGLVLGLLSLAAAPVREGAMARVSLLAANAESGNGDSEIRFADG
ncbi:MAG: hypothetical protein J6K46_04445 [Sutterella sp.]|nr:hypothetical protein [Sutterella sp.]